MPGSCVRVERSRDQAVLRLCLPPVNAMGLPLLRDLDAVVAGLAAAPPSGGVVITGDGPAFCAGADIKAAPAYGGGDWSELRRLADRAFAALALLPVPTVAALNGHALGGGLVLALACDGRIATTAPARFGLPEVTHAIAFPDVALAVVQEALSPATLRDLALSGRHVGNAEAMSLGVVDALAPAPELVARAGAWAAERAALRGFATIKAQLRGGLRARLAGQPRRAEEPR